MTPSDLIAKMVDAWNAGDKATYMACASPNVQEDEGQGSFARRSGEFLWDKLHAAFAGSRLEAQTIVEQGEYCAAEVIFSGRHVGPFQFAPDGIVQPTGKAVRFPFVVFARVQNDVIVSENAYGITVGIADQLEIRLVAAPDLAAGDYWRIP